MPHPKTINPAANLSLVLPGPCNADCSFCFWERNDAEEEDYGNAVYNQLIALDDAGFSPTQISITGGEPTLSPAFDDVMEQLRGLETKVVLTTNGAKLLQKIDKMSPVDHINISRHAIDDDENYAIFGTNTVPDTADLKRLCKKANRNGIDVTLNRVIDSGLSSKQTVNDFIKYAKSVGASAVCFRVDYGAENNDMSMLPVQDYLGQFKESGCPVCKTYSYLIKGMPVSFKMSVMEPSSVKIPEIYELIIQPDGRLTTDWAGMIDVDLNSLHCDAVPVTRTPAPRHAIIGNCGRVGFGCDHHVAAKIYNHCQAHRTLSC